MQVMPDDEEEKPKKVETIKEKGNDDPTDIISITYNKKRDRKWTTYKCGCVSVTYNDEFGPKPGSWHDDWKFCLKPHGCDHETKEKLSEQ